ncbi:hypothetical protein LshimejAT787_1701490 [Lyophyllum shimeji]|uniref:Uncharacterized protein n=1 Tax=Lyophyllum shimeji TaxID=47721 RepID=A0A9P3Q0B8_LYOSH|nr:hypothetical protein LshimejAT787_1701490 [Lyophyllum shimeji]
MAEIFNTFREFRLYLEQHNTPTVPRDSGPAAVQPADAAQTPRSRTPSPRSPSRAAEIGLRAGAPRLLRRREGERARFHQFLRSLHVPHPDTFPDEQTRINWVLSYMKGAAPLVSPPAHSVIPIPMAGSPVFGTYAEFRTQFIAEFCPRDEKRKAATTFETSAYHQGSPGVPLPPRSDPRIEAKVANIVEGRPSDERVQEWIDRRVWWTTTPVPPDFRSAVTKPCTAPLPPSGTRELRRFFRALPPPTSSGRRSPFRSHCSSQSPPSLWRSDGH